MLFVRVRFTEKSSPKIYPRNANMIEGTSALHHSIRTFRDFAENDWMPVILPTLKHTTQKDRRVQRKNATDCAKAFQGLVCGGGTEHGLKRTNPKIRRAYRDGLYGGSSHLPHEALPMKPV